MDTEIILKNYRCFADTSPMQFLLRKGFTAIVGTNNSGKSSLLKFFFELRPLFAKSLSGPLSGLIDAARGVGGLELAKTVTDTSEIFCNSNSRNMSIQLGFAAVEVDNYAQDEVALLPTQLTVEIPRDTRSWRAKFQNRQGMVNFREGTGSDIDRDRLREDGVPRVNLAPVRAVGNVLANTLYIGPFRNAINIGGDDSYFDIQVGQAFIRTWKSYKTGDNKRQNEAAIDVTENVRRIFGFRSLEINASDDGQTLQLFIDRRSYKLSELGAGMAQFILVLVTAAIKRPSPILIDEPELNLHPSLQLDFLTTLGSYASEGVLFATHSMGLARASADRIYTVRITHDGDRELADLETTPRLSEFLGELSFSGYKELGYDKVLLVEGSTEIKTLQQLLRKWDREHQIVMLPLGGSNLINGSREAELLEVKRISENICALIDSERTDATGSISAERQAFVKVCKKVGIDVCVLDRRAIENYWPDRAVKATMGEKYRALSQYERLTSAHPHWAKSENWRIARETTRDELRETDLGQFLSHL